MKSAPPGASKPFITKPAHNLKLKSLRKRKKKTSYLAFWTVNTLVADSSYCVSQATEGKDSPRKTAVSDFISPVCASSEF